MTKESKGFVWRWSHFMCIHIIGKSSVIFAFQQRPNHIKLEQQTDLANSLGLNESDFKSANYLINILFPQRNLGKNQITNEST